MAIFFHGERISCADLARISSFKENAPAQISPVVGTKRITERA
jgi:hypothetical protein